MNKFELSNSKNQQRQKVLALRDALAPETRIERALQACEKAIDTIPFQMDDIISAYLPIRSEIDPRPLMATLQQRGARLCLPVVIDKQTIVFRELIRGEKLVRAGFGTIGPDINAKTLNPTIMIMPLAGFDRHGGRLGYGAGHYDRAIARLVASGKKPRLIGLAFNIQMVDRVATEPHDQMLDMIITETGAISAG